MKKNKLFRRPSYGLSSLRSPSANSTSADCTTNTLHPFTRHMLFAFLLSLSISHSSLFTLKAGQPKTMSDIKVTNSAELPSDTTVGGTQAATTTETEANAAAISTHTADTDNPHSVTASQVGLGNVDNTADTDKPVSTATQTALDAKADETDLTSHTGNTDNPHSVTKAQVGLGSVANILDNLTATAAPTVTDDSSDGYSAGSWWYYSGTLYICTDATEDAAVWTEISGGSGAVDSVNGYTGTVVLTKSDISLGNVANVLNNYAATAAPATTDDTSEGYSVGSLWFDTTNQVTYICYDATEDTAVWSEIGSGSSTAADTTVDASSFSGNLSSTDSTVQAALETLNSMTVSDAPKAADVLASNYGQALVVDSVRGGNDSYTTLLTHLDATDASFVDVSNGSSATHTLTNSGATYNSSGKFDGCAYFDGSSVITIPASSEFATTNQLFTVECWFKTTNSTAKALVSNTVSTSSWPDLYDSWTLRSDGLAYTLDGESTHHIVYHEQTYDNDAWHHIAMVQNGSDLMLFFDGTLTNTIDVSTDNMGKSDNHITIGDADFGVTNFTGDIDEVRISKGVARWTEDFTPPTSSYILDANSWTFASASTDAIDGTERITTTLSDNTAVTHTQAELVGSTPIVSVTASTDNIDKDNQGKLTKVDNDDGAALTLIAEVDDTDTDVPIGGWVDVMNVNGADMTVTAASGVTLNGTDAASVTISEGQCIRFTKSASDTWVYGITLSSITSSDVTTALGYTPASDTSTRYSLGSISGAVTIDYDNGDIQVATSSAAITGFTFSNLSTETGMVVQIDNSGGYSVTFGSTEIISSSDTGVYACKFYNDNGTIYFYGKSERQN